MEPVFIPYEKIDKIKWDNCVQQSLSPLLYASSIYLDFMADRHWDGLVLGNYEAVMPLPWRKKYGIKYIYMPAFIQQLGIFSSEEITTTVLFTFLEKLKENFRFAEYNFNAWNINEENSHDFSTRTNYILSLKNTYDRSFNNYTRSFAKSLRRLKKWPMLLAHSQDVGEAVKLSKQLYSDRIAVWKGKDYAQFENLCKQLQAQNKIQIRKVLLDGELLALTLLADDGKRLYNLVSCTTELGKKLEANYFLYDKIIEEYSGKDYILDLEGSDIPGIAAFYNKMNPQNEPYWFFRYNNLPVLMKLFKS